MLTDSKDRPNKSQDLNTVKVYFCPGPAVNVCLRFSAMMVSDQTLRKFIDKCLERLHQQYMLDVHSNPTMYIISVANKFGKRKEGYPSLDLDAKIETTKFKRFYLEDISKTASSMSKEVNLERKYGIKQRQKMAAQEGISCSFLSLLKC